MKLLDHFGESEVGSPKSLVIHQGEKIFSVRYSDIRILYLKEGVLYLINNEGQKHIVSLSLDRIEQELDKNFFRVNRQVIIHRDAISYSSSFYARKLLVTPKYRIDFEIVVSKANASHFLKWLES